MKNNVSSSSIQAIHELRRNGISINQRQTIIHWLSGQHYPATRNEIAKATGIDKSAVAGRVNGMVGDGILVETRKRNCRISGKCVGTVAIPIEKQSA